MRKGVIRAAKILCIAYFTGGVLTWACDVWLEAHHPEDYSNTEQFMTVMADEFIPTILFWPPMVWLDVELRMGWKCYSAEIGKC